MKRNDVERYIKEKFDVLDEQIFPKYPNFSAFRHKKNEKWFALLMRLSASKLGLESDEMIEVLNLKCSPDLAMVLVDEEQIFKAYHMNKKHWISVNLNSKISQKTVFDLIDESFVLSK
ncbi:MmcQ/YjbR family DNA-binding protein [Campylobacter concisus]|uniref:MmcQ/YjbR family DNA-binding protein n=1 Tax=Campylobacter concisus TaxID=199 RepID=UPI000CD84975|nr:MmcQ/YjbR family DNA-binding protein [Campylobacter concisus]